MSKGTQKFFEAIKDLAQQNAQRIGPEVAKEAEGVLAHGAHELAAALFTGSGFVMYPRAAGIEQGQSVEGPQAPEATPEPDRDSGMER